MRKDRVVANDSLFTRFNKVFATMLRFVWYICRMNRINWDLVGISASVACAIHCALLPLVLTSLPILGINIINNVMFEYGMILLAFIVGFYSLWHGYRRHHHSAAPLLVFSAGIMVLLAKQVWHNYEMWFIPLAVLLIVVAHLRNYRACRIHNHAHSDDCNH